MLIRTSLLVTDDHDDHVAFSEALSEISAQTIVLVALDSVKALALVRSKKFIPDYFFLDLSMPGIKINSFLKVIHTRTSAFAEYSNGGVRGAARYSTRSRI